MRFKLGVFALCVAGSIAPLAAHAVCNANIVADAPDERYTINGATVTDTHTGLVWKRCVEGQSGAACNIDAAVAYTWQGALQQVATANAQASAGFSDWRLPNRNELESLVERKCVNPAINETIFPATPAQGSWSSSTNHRLAGADGTLAWGVDFNSGSMLPVQKTQTRVVRLVRSGS